MVARVGVIESVDLEAGKVVVAMGDLKTPPIDWVMSVGDTTIWIPPTEGQQVCVLTPDGDAEQAFVLGGLPSSAMAPLFLGLKNAVRFKDGAVASYDPEENELRFELPGGMKIVAPEGLEITGDVKINGKGHITDDVQVDKTLTATTDVVGAGKSLKGHRHLGVTTGGGISGIPQ